MSQATRFLKRNLLWVLFIGFGIMAIMTMSDQSLFLSQGPYPFGKDLIWLIFAAFMGYTIYASRKENFFKSVKKISQLYWGWQIGLDLYIGLLLPLLLIYLNGGAMIFFLWLVPILLNANLFTLLYFALNYDSLVAQFLL
ncbi:MAG: hypothetical protein AAFV80_13890 [Bacteroidota bacterium]